MSEEVEIGPLESLPRDTGKIVIAGTEEIAVFRVGNRAYAIDNICPHREGPLGDGYLSGEVVTCPFHAWEINVRTGEVVDFPSECTRTFACRVEGGIVYVDTGRDS